MDQKSLPNATTNLVLGIISIALCWLWGIPGIVCGIISIMLHKKDKAIYESDPAAYDSSFKTSKAGQICGIIGLSLSAIMFLYMVVYLLIIGSMFAGAINTINHLPR